MPDMKPPMHDVAGKIAFVTGGSSGIGLGIVQAFLNAGMKVAFSYRTPAHYERAMQRLAGHERDIHAIDVDVTDRQGMAAAARETVERFGKVHVLVNNAAIGLITGLADPTYDDWDWATRVNIDGVFNGIREFLPKIREHGEGGHIVATSSMGGLVVAKGGVYSATKFAVVGMMEGLRSELAGSNIGASVYCPGGVNSAIRHSERNRPSELPSAGFRPSAGDLATMAEMERRHPDPESGPGMDPLEAGEWVLRGIRTTIYTFCLIQSSHNPSATAPRPFSLPSPVLRSRCRKPDWTRSRIYCVPKCTSSSASAWSEGTTCGRPFADDAGHLVGRGDCAPGDSASCCDGGSMPRAG